MTPVDARAELGLTQQAFADLVGVTVRQVKRWEVGATVGGPSQIVIDLMVVLHRAGKLDEVLAEAARLDDAD